MKREYVKKKRQLENTAKAVFKLKCVVCGYYDNAEKFIWNSYYGEISLVSVKCPKCGNSHNVKDE